MNGCAIRRSRANAVLGVGAVAGHGLRNVYHSSARRWPARPVERRRIVWNAPEQSFAFLKRVAVFLKRVTFFLKEWYSYTLDGQMKPLKCVEENEFAKQIIW